MSDSTSAEWWAADKGPHIVTVCWIFTGIASAAVTARIYVRIFVKQGLMFDDYCVLLSIFCAILASILTTISFHYGIGRHFTTLSTEQMQMTIKWMIFAYVPGIMSLGFPKLAVISLLTRLLLPSKFHKILLWTLGGYCLASLAATVMALTLQCSPPRSLYDFSVEGTCINKYILVGLSFNASITSAFLDFYLAIYPAITIFKLQMSTYKKVGLSFALGIGLISGCIAIKKTTGVPTLLSSDISWDLSEPLLWTSIEANAIIISACIPILQPLGCILLGRTRSDNKPYEDLSNKDAKIKTVGSIQLRQMKKSSDEFGFTIQGRDDDSQRTIMDPANNEPGDTTGREREDGKEVSGNDQKIYVIRSIEVVEAEAEGGPVSSQARWAPV